MKRKQGEAPLKKKVEFVSASRIKNTPSPIKNPHRLRSELAQQQTSEDTKIIIKHSELVQFTKKFAFQKADYQDKIFSIETENESLRSRISEMEGAKSTKYKIELNSVESTKEPASRLSVTKNQSSKLTQQNLYLSHEVTSLRNQLQKSKHQLSIQKNKVLQHSQQVSRSELESTSKSLNQKIFQCLQHQKQIFNLRSQISEISQLYNQVKQQVARLREVQIDKARESFSQKSIVNQDQRIRLLEGDVARLRNLNQLFRTQLKNEDSDSKKKNRVIEQLQNQVLTLEDQLQKQYPHDLIKRIDTLESDKEHLQNQLFLERANTKKRVQLEQNCTELKEHLASRNTIITQLTFQLGCKGNDNSQVLVAKCCELQSHIQRLNRFIIQLKAEANNNPNISQSGYSLDDYRSKHNQMLDQIKNLKGDCNESSIRLPPIEELMNELEQNPSKFKIMEDIITSLRIENNQLKQAIGCDSNLIAQTAQQELKEIMYEMSRAKMQAEDANQTLKFKIDSLQYQLDKFKSLQNSEQNHNQSKSFNKSFSEIKKSKLHGVLRKMAEYSRQMILPGQQNSFEGDLYETVIGKLLNHIQNLESQPKHSHYSYCLDE